MRAHYTHITTYDTKKLYTYPQTGEDENPQLWEIKLSIAPIGLGGNTKYDHSEEALIHVERKTLLEAGLISTSKAEVDFVSIVKTPEDLILELLEAVGVYPTGENSN